jgi:hypothetical protein
MQQNATSMGNATNASSWIGNTSKTSDELDMTGGVAGIKLGDGG